MLASAMTEGGRASDTPDVRRIALYVVTAIVAITVAVLAADLPHLASGDYPFERGRDWRPRPRWADQRVTRHAYLARRAGAGARPARQRGRLPGWVTPKDVQTLAGGTMRRFTNSRRTLVGLVLMATLGIAACSANHAPSAAGSGNGHSTIPTATAVRGSAQPPARQRTDDHLTAPPAPAAPTPTSGTSLVPMQTAQGGEFVSPSGNISCEVDYNRDGVTAAYCETGTPRSR